MVNGVTFAAVLLLLTGVGFGTAGVGMSTPLPHLGNIASINRFFYLTLREVSSLLLSQSWAYEDFTPAGGFFATLTSMGMLGTLLHLEVGVAAMSVAVVTAIIWACGVDRGK